MKFQNRIRRLAVACTAAALVSFSVPAFAQDVSDSHLKAAREAVASINATDAFDAILPQAAASLQASLIQKNPDLQELIGTTISAKALAMASRRADLEREADLKAIAAFYTSAAGKKLLESGPIVSRELVRAAEIWQNGIARDLAQEVGEALQSAAGAQVQPADGTETPAEGQAPASGN